MLAAISIVVYNMVQNQAIQSTLKSDLRNASVALSAANASQGRYPSAIDAAGETDESVDFVASDGVRVQYSLLEDNQYCLSASSTKRGAYAFHITHDQSEPVEGVCDGQEAPGPGQGSGPPPTGGEPGGPGGGGSTPEIVKADIKNLSFTDTSGYTSQYHVWSSHIDTGKPIGMLFHMHGDMAWEFNNPESDLYIGGANGIHAQAVKRNMVLVVPKAPDQEGDVTWWEDYTIIINWTYRFVPKMLNDFHVDRSRVWFSGFSGGAEYISYYGLPYVFRQSGITGGGAVIIGGGGSPQSYLPSLPKSTNIPGPFPLTWYVGEFDDGTNAYDNFDALEASRRGELYYRNNGWDTERIIIPGYEHTIHRKYGEVIDEAMNKAGFTGV